MVPRISGVILRRLWSRVITPVTVVGRRSHPTMPSIEKIAASNQTVDATRGGRNSTCIATSAFATDPTTTVPHHFGCTPLCSFESPHFLQHSGRTHQPGRTVHRRDVYFENFGN